MSTQTTVNVGLALPGEQPVGRLEAAGSFGSDRLARKVTLRAVADVNDELRAWLRRTWEQA